MNKLNRRAALTSVLSVGALGINEAFAGLSNKSNSGKYIIAVHLSVGSLPSYKAEAFAERVLNNLKKKKPKECSSICMIPHRREENKIEVFPVGKDNVQSKQAIEKYIYTMPSVFKSCLKNNNQGK